MVADGVQGSHGGMLTGVQETTPTARSLCGAATAVPRLAAPPSAAFPVRPAAAPRTKGTGETKFLVGSGSCATHSAIPFGEQALAPWTCASQPSLASAELQALSWCTSPQGSLPWPSSPAAPACSSSSECMTLPALPQGYPPCTRGNANVGSFVPPALSLPALPCGLPPNSCPEITALGRSSPPQFLTGAPALSASGLMDGFRSHGATQHSDPFPSFEGNVSAHRQGMRGASHHQVPGYDGGRSLSDR
eukprot:scaffold257755_cov32-Tisochrysis_lutea.AAC.3